MKTNTNNTGKNTGKTPATQNKKTTADTRKNEPRTTENRNTENRNTRTDRTGRTERE